MRFIETIQYYENQLLDAMDGGLGSRPHRLAELERKLHKGFDSWTAAHKKRYPRMGQLPYRPDEYEDQRLDRPYRPINKIARTLGAAERSEGIPDKVKPAVYLGNLAYLAFIKQLHAKTVGSKELSRTMIEAFQVTPAHDTLSSSPSMVDYTVEKLSDSNVMAVGLSSAHLQELADIGEFSAALNIAIAEEHGFKYIDAVNTVINNNMTRQTYKVGAIRVPIARLATTGTGVFWGTPPGESATEHGIGDEELAESNQQLSKAFLRVRKDGNIVIAYVPSGSGAKRVINEQTGELEKIIFKDTSYTASITARCNGGIIVVNREGNQIAISPVIPYEQPAGMGRKTYENILTDRVMEEHAAQAYDLTGAPAEFTRLHPAGIQA